MIVEYHRPDTIEDALTLLARPQPETRPMGGGTVLNAPSAEGVAVVDLQSLGLSAIESKGKKLHIGATASLQNMLDFEETTPAIVASLQHEASYNLRQAGTVAGSLVAADGRSPLGVAMLALDAQLVLQPGDEETSYGNLLPKRAEALKGRLITSIIINKQVQLAYHYVARSPADLPIVALALAAWPSGRTRLALGGFGSAPHLALDGQEPSGLKAALENALSDAGDQWASAEYRLEAGKALLGRAKNEMGLG